MPNTSVSLSAKLSEWLREQNNSSEFIRHILTQMEAREADLALHGHGDLVHGVVSLLDRQTRIMRDALPPLTLDQAKAIAACLKGYPLWAEYGMKKMALGPALAHELTDYRQLESLEADQWDVDWDQLINQVANYDNLQVLALGHAVEAFFQDQGDDPDTIIRRHFRMDSARMRQSAPRSTR